MLIQITEPKFTILFQPQDITRITPVIDGLEVDYYLLKLSSISEFIKLSPSQLAKLLPHIQSIDISIELDK